MQIKEAGACILIMYWKCTQFFRTYENIKGSKIFEIDELTKILVDQKVKIAHKKPTCETIHTLQICRLWTLILIEYEKNVHCSKLLLLQSFYCLLWNVSLTGVAYLMIDTYTVFLILTGTWRYSFIYYSIVQLISSYQLSYCFSVTYVNFKEYREYQTLHQTSSCVISKLFQLNSRLSIYCFFLNDVINNLAFMGIK